MDLGLFGKLSRWLCLVLLPAALVGCASRATIDSHADKGAHSELHRLLIVSNLWPLTSVGQSSALDSAVVETALVQAFGKCGIDTEIVRQDRFSPGGDGLEALRVYSPDAIFVLETQRFDFNVVNGGGDYSGKIVEMTTKKMAWQARVHITDGRSREEVLAGSILDSLKADSILCTS